MISDKIPSSPTFSGNEKTLLTNNDHRSEPAHLMDLAHQNTGAERTIERCQSSDTGLGSAKESTGSSTKAEFYIGDDGILQTPTPFELQSSPFEFRPRVKNMSAEGVSFQPQDECASAKNQALPVPEFIPPDGGYGWVIAFSACVINLFIVGFIKSYGVLYVSVQKAFPEATAYQASWLPVFLSTIGLLLAPVTGILCRKFTSRKVSFVGGIFAFAGIFLGAFANSMIEMIFTLGLLTGIGAGLTTTPAVLITSLYFEKRRTLASAICVSGNAIGGFLFPPLTEFFLTHYGLRGTLYIIAALQLHICAASMLFRPIRLHALIQCKEKRREQNKEKYLPCEDSETLVSPVDQQKMTSNISRQESLLKRILIQNRQNQDSIDPEEEQHLRYELSFLRSCSMMNSIPDLTEYARSWSFDQSPAMSQYPSFKAICKESKSTLVNKMSQNILINELEKVSIRDKTREGSYPSLRNVSSQPLTREVSRMNRQKMPLVLELETDSQTSLSDMVALETPQATTEEQQGNISGCANETDVFIDQNLNIKTKEKQIKLSKDPEMGTRTKLDEVKPSSKFFDRTLLRSGALWLMCSTIALMATGAPHALFFLPAYAASVDIDQAAVIYLMSISSMVDLVGRLGTGFISELKIFKSSLLYGILQCLAGTALILLPIVSSITGVGILMSLYGFGVGGWFVLIPVILAEHHGVHKLAASYGIVRLCQGIMNFTSPQVSGLIIDASKSYSCIYYVMGVSMAFGGLLMLIEPFLVARKNRC